MAAGGDDGDEGDLSIKVVVETELLVVAVGRAVFVKVPGDEAVVVLAVRYVVFMVVVIGAETVVVLAVGRAVFMITADEAVVTAVNVVGFEAISFWATLVCGVDSVLASDITSKEAVSIFLYGSGGVMDSFRATCTGRSVLLEGGGVIG